MKSFFIPLVLIINLVGISSIVSFGQEDGDGTVLPQIYPGAIPSSPAFSLLGVNPEIITRPSDIKEFKVDWRIKNYKVAPDLALEFQPLWWLYYRKKGLQAYHKATPFQRILSTASLSLATAKIDGLNHMGTAIKFNLYKAFDPFLDKSLEVEYEKMKAEVLTPLYGELDSLFLEFKFAKTDTTRARLKEELEVKEMEIEGIQKGLMDEYQWMGSELAKQKWNTDMIDVAFGLVNKYDNAAFDSLNMQYAGFGIWVNGAKGLGKSSLLTGMARFNRIGQNNNLLLGASYRYGSEKFNVFVELVYQRLGNNFENGFHEEEIFSGNRDYDIGTGWYAYGEGEGYSMYTISYGGDFRLSRNILLNFALRTQLKRDTGFDSLLPVANLVCLMN